ncbi:Zn-ribbon domain-containing OB-fold protein [Haloplanus sp.]|uniref:Zn-ribbon domain-containing OB-fold protein n=1 Tax=Haloplanus sp. TaxID=1961696 RepID=UPI0026353D7B|nr:OB-fold domain-containing protein [Haloplanus sp.]
MTDAGYDEWLDAVGENEGYYLECPEGHGALPPRRVCPECAAADLDRAALPESGTVETFTVCHVAGPSFADEEPYVTAIAEFGPVRLTGVVRGTDPEDVTVDTPVEADKGTNETTGEGLLVLRVR